MGTGSVAYRRATVLDRVHDHRHRGLARHFPDGVWMVELAELDSPGLLPYCSGRLARCS